MATETDRPPENGGEPKGEMGEDGTHEFFVVNVTTGPSTARCTGRAAEARPRSR